MHKNSLPFLMFAAAMVFSTAAVAAGKAREDESAALDDKVAAEYIKTHDRNGDAKVSLDEYQDWKALRSHAPHLESSAKAGFAALDINRDAFLDTTEVKAELARHRAEIQAQH